MGKFFRPRADITTSAGLDALLRAGVGATWAGVTVTPASAKTISTVFACTRNIVEDLGKLPFEVFQQTGDHERTRATTSPYWRLIHDRPNGYMTSQQFREFLTECAVNRGNGCAFKNIVGGQIRELLPIHPDHLRIEQTPDFELLYHVRAADGTEQAYTRRQIFHLPGLTIDGPIGVSVIEYARQTLGNALGANRHSGTFFGNGMKPSGVFTLPKGLSKQAHQNLKDDLNARFNGDNSNETLLLEDGLDFKAVSLNARDSQFLESRNWEAVQICAWYRMPPHKVAILDHATFTNIEHQGIEYVTDNLMTWGVRWEYAVNGQVIGTNAVWAELNYDALLRGDTTSRYNAYQKAAGGPAPWLSRNDIRRKENLPPVAGLDEILQPLNMTTAGAGGTDAETSQ